MIWSFPLWWSSGYQLLTPPFQPFTCRMESLILGEEQFLSGKINQISFAVRASGVENVRNPPMMVGAWGYQIAVHGPVVVLAEGEAIGGVVVATVGEGN